jgi:hypothetical protein
MSGVLSDMLTASLAKHSRTLTVNCYFNGHPDLVRKGVYPNNAVKAGDQGVEVKTTRKPGGAVVGIDDFRKNARGELGTRTATLHAQGIAKLRSNWVYRL